jgi:hypothetical protein
MAGDFLPRREAEWVTWSANFRDHIVSDPQAVALSQEQVDQFVILNAEFAEAFRLSENDATRTPIAIRRKREAKDVLEAEIRKLAGIIRASGMVSTADRAGLGLSTRRPGGRRKVIGRPMHAPTVWIESVRGYTVNIRLLNTEEPTRRGRPIGVGYGRIWLAIGETPPEELKKWQFVRSTKLTRCAVQFNSKIPVATRVWICAQWASPTGEPGPAAKPASTYLHAGVIQPRPKLNRAG